MLCRLSGYTPPESSYSDVSSQPSQVKPLSPVKKMPSPTVQRNHIIIQGEMRAVWIPYFYLDMKGTDYSQAAFQKKIDRIIAECKEYQLNTLIVHTVAFSDALYPSKIFPMSHIISGTQGKSVDYNPLQMIIDSAHKNHLSVHAWVNPLRIQTSETPEKLSTDNPAVQWKNEQSDNNNPFIMTYKNGLYYNPSSPEVRKLIIGVISEIVQNYEVDGIQLDDYFYPSEEPDCDKVAYQAYQDTVSEPLSQSDWRKANINALICGIYNAIHTIDNEVQFGIAPQCNFNNNDKISADIESWCSVSRYIDYICPQLYVNEFYPIEQFRFTPLAKQWKEKVKNQNLRLYFGLSLYKCGTDADGGSWLKADNHIGSAVRQSRTMRTQGFMLYSIDSFSDSAVQKELQKLPPPQS